MNYLKQTIAQMHEQPLATWLTVAGTAISLFLVMAVFIMNNVKQVAVAPMSDRSRILIGAGMHAEDSEGYGSSSMGMSKSSIDQLYGNLEGIERTALFGGNTETVDASAAGKLAEEYSLMNADNEYWNIFDFSFLSGKPYTKAENDANLKVAVITEGAARRLFGKADVTGLEFMVKQVPYRVVGVVKGASPLLSPAYADIYVPAVPGTGGAFSWMDEYIGGLEILLLKKPGVSDEFIKKQVRERYERVNARLKKDGRALVFHNGPYNAEELGLPHGSNTTPDSRQETRRRWIIYSILILLPAINLSGMTNSRLRRRVSEIGVRRAFGATKLGIIGQLLVENFLLTLIGGIIGFLFCILFLYLFAALFVNMVDYWDVLEAQTSATPTFSMMFTWTGFGFALLFCLILNLASAGIPVWKAASVNPAEAISGNNNENK